MYNLSKPVPTLFGDICAIHVMAVSYNFQAMSFIKLFGMLCSKDMSHSMVGESYL